MAWRSEGEAPTLALRRRLSAGAALLCSVLGLACVRDRADVWATDGSACFDGSLFDGWQRSSRYVAMRDGVELAVDLLRPTRAGSVVEDPLPAIWTLERYRRAFRSGSGQRTLVDEYRWLARVICNGYVAVVVDARGTGASNGSRFGPFEPEERRDAYDVTEWIAAQPWSTERVGMFGRSYGGITQYLAAAEDPPHLVAIMPEMALFDLYGFVHPAGILRDDFLASWSRNVRRMDLDGSVLPVSSDVSRARLKQAVAEHHANRSALELFASHADPCSVHERSGLLLYGERSPSAHLDAIQRSGVAVYHVGGWNDMWPADTIRWFQRLSPPRKLLIGSWHHTEYDHDLLAKEHTRWWDHWLKGVDNGVMDEAPVRFSIRSVDGAEQWREATTWPPAGIEKLRLYLGSQRGVLQLKAPSPEAAPHLFAGDASATTGTGSRWANGYGRAFGYGDMSVNDAKGLSYTTPPLEETLEVIGTPVVELRLDASAEFPLFAYLERVDAHGRSHYVTEGVARFDGQRWETLQDAFPCDGETTAADGIAEGSPAVAIRIELLPTAHTFAKGSRMRLSLRSADRDNYRTSTAPPTRPLSIHIGGADASSILLPVQGDGAAPPW